MLAYPSLDEGFGFPLLEAQAAGTPVVATRVGSIPEVAGDGAELVPAGDRDALAGALTRVVTDDDRRRELVAAGTANLARFSWSSAAASMVALYRRLGDEPSPQPASDDTSVGSDRRSLQRNGTRSACNC